MHRLTTVCLLLAASIPAAQAQSPSAAAPAAVVTAQAMQDALKSAPSGQSEINKIVRGVSAPGEKISVDINRRMGSEEGGVLHERVTEVYTIISGGGTLKTGGTLIDPKPMQVTQASSIGPSQRGSSINGGETRHVGVGDVVVIPALTPHMFTSLDGTIVYSVIRIDPAH
jgi:mannose-6-phosphate isomerase-like protein (cupin superfamily)